MADLLSLSAHLPEIDFTAGDVVVSEGDAAGSIWVLVDGSLEVRKGDVSINTTTHPGSLVGEMSVLLGAQARASVVATGPCRLRHAIDGKAFLSSDPEITTLVAAGLAERLNFVNTYLADLKHQYGDAPGLAMVSDVLSKLSQHTGPAAQSGSAREPNPEY